MKKVYYAALIYMVLGLVSGMFSRYYLQATHFDGDSQLDLLHFHILVLGMLVNLVWLVLDGVYNLSRNKKWFSLAFWHYNGGVVVTLLSMVLIGVRQAAGAGDVPHVLAGVSGAGHVVLTVGLCMFFYVLFKALPKGK